jgi:hypothetical protein
MKIYKLQIFVDKLILAQSSINTDKTKILISASISWSISTSKLVDEHSSQIHLGMANAIIENNKFALKFLL